MFSRLPTVRKYSFAETAKVKKMTAAISAAVCDPPMRSRFTPPSSLAVLEHAIGPDHGKEDEPFGDLLSFNRNAEQDQEIVEYTEHEHTNQRAECAAAATEEAGAAEHGRDY